MDIHRHIEEGKRMHVVIDAVIDGAELRGRSQIAAFCCRHIQ